MVVCWDDLPADAYTHTLADLADWIGWLRATYRIPATVIPPCWFTHPALREDIGHLWTGWLLTRHPDAGVGMIGLDWDQRRDAAINRLREATAITGCTATRHQAEPEPVPATPTAAERLWHDHLDQQTRQRIRAAALQAAADVVTGILQARNSGTTSLPRSWPTPPTTRPPPPTTTANGSPIACTSWLPTPSTGPHNPPRTLPGRPGRAAARRPRKRRRAGSGRRTKPRPPV
jgi:hypothetical protein